MYDLLIVEDEEEIREGIKECLESETDFLNIRTAKNGEKAVEAIESSNVDAMLLDIRMPVMDGAEVLRELEARKIYIPVVILSGYDDFQYAKGAIQYGVLDYVLKPVTPDGVVGIVYKLKQQLDAKAEQMREIDNLKEQVRDKFNTDRERFFNDLVFVGINDEAYRTKAEYFGLDMVIEACQAAVVDIPVQNSDRSREIRQLAEKLLNECLTTHKAFGVFQLGSEQIIILFRYPAGTSPDWKLTELTGAIDKLKKLSGIEISMGIGNVYEGLSGIKKSYIEALNAVKYKIITGRAGIFCYWKLVSGRGSYKIPFDPENFKLKLEIGPVEEAKAAVLKVFDMFSCNSGNISMDTVYAFAGLIISSITILITESGRNIYNVYPQCINPFTEIYSIGSIDGIRQFVIDMVEKCAEEISVFRNEKSRNIIEMSKGIINNQCSEDITTKYLADIFYLNPDYFGRIFKQDTGFTVSSYLNKVRIGKAMELLEEGKHSVCEIAGMVGFNDQHYFSTVFRKITGRAPTDFK